MLYDFAPYLNKAFFEANARFNQLASIEESGQAWKATNEEDLLSQLATDEHAPAKVRVNGVLNTTDAFYEAFDVQPGDKMYVDSENRAKLF